MKAVILAGGLGSRLSEETSLRPKPMVEIGGYPILWHIMKIYAHSGFREFVLCLGYRGNMIKEYFLNYEAMNNDFTICLGHESRIQYNGLHTEQGFEVTLADTGLNTMTGGRLQRVRNYVQGETFMLTYGDGVADIDIARLLAFHRQHGKAATVTTVTPTSRFGIVEMSGSGQVLQFVEKPKTEAFASAGFFVFEPKIFDYLGADDCILERVPLQRLAADGELMAYEHPGFFYAMDTYREYEHLNELWSRHEAPWKVW
jgi:glucose-1-phosphate cytidylyltransferase